MAPGSQLLSVVAQLGATDCERLGDGLVAQPVNTMSSLAFVVAGVVIGSTRRSDARRSTAIGFGAIVAGIGLGSVAFHGPQPDTAQLLHDAPIVLAVAFVVVGSIRRPVPGRSWARPLALLGAGVAAWTLGRTDAPLCAPGSLLQPHAAWHLLAAAAIVAWWRATPSIVDPVDASRASDRLLR